MFSIRRYFLAGLLVVLPIFITVYVLFAIFRFIDSLWGGLLNRLLTKYLGIVIPGLGFILGIATILVIGFLTTHFLGKRVLYGLERWFLKLPFVRQIYPSAKQIIDFLFSRDKAVIKRVVMIEYPSKGIWAVGFLTNNEWFKKAKDITGRELLPVLIGTTPSPWSGLLVFVPKEEVKFLDISVEDAFKLIVSGGILSPS